MSKKRVKSGAGSAGAHGVQRWEQALLSTPFYEEGKWSCTINFVVGNQIEDNSHINVLTSAVSAGTRRLCSIITREELMAQVIELGSPKGKKPKEVPLNYEVCEPCKDHLDSGEDIPIALLAKLLKFKLLDIKQKDLKRRETEKKSDQGKDKGGKKGGGDKKERSKSPGKGGKGGKKTPEPPSAKDGSKLKKRGEEDLDSKYIDDEPDDGTSHYVFVSGFHEPHLIGQLAEISIDIDAITKVTSEDYARFAKQNESSDDLDPAPIKDERQQAAEDEARKVAARHTKQLRLFWKDVPLLLQMAPQSSKLQDVARLEYIVKDAIIPQSLDDNDARTVFGGVLFEDMACLLYNLLDAKRQWRNFLNNLKLIPVPVFGQTSPQAVHQDSQPSAPLVAPGKLDKGAVPEPVLQTEPETKLTKEVDMRYYNELMNCVPIESTSVPLLMHCMLEQICATEEDKEPPSETPRPLRSDGMDETLAKHVGTMAFKLALSDGEQQILSGEFEPPKKPEPIPKQPTLLSYRDDISHRLNHLKPVGDFNPMKAELEMMGYLHVARLQDAPCTTPRELKERAARLQELLHFCATGGTTVSEVDHAFKQFVFESMNLTQTDPEGTVINPDPEQVDIQWDDPYPYFVGMIPRLEDDQTVEDPGIPERSGAKSPTPSLSVDARSPVSADERPPSCPPSPGILKRDSSNTSRKSLSAHSVHFERDEDGNMLEQPGDNDEELHVEPEVDMDPMELQNDTQKRNLDQWCFAEHLDHSIFLQVLQESVYTHPYIDTYHHQRDNSMLVVLHNPYADNLQRTEEWTCQIHSNVGFRNYLEHISESVTDWTRDEEAKYQARILAKEVERLNKESEEASSRPTSAKDKKRDRSKSPKKSPSRSGRSPSRTSSAERPSSANPFVREGSLKAWKEEQDRIRQEDDEKEKQKQEKRARSATKKASKEQAAADEKEKKRPGSRSSSKSKVSKDEAPPPDKTEEPQVPEPFWPFTGYDLGNQMLHAKGTVSSMFPADGGQIRTEKYQFEHGPVGVKSVVLKDGHTFMVHVLDPKGQEEEEIDMSATPDGSTVEEHEKADLEKSEKDDSSRRPQKDEASSKPGTPRTPRTGASTPVEGATVNDPSIVDDSPPKPCVGAFGSFTAQMCDGMSLALSIYGRSGEPIDGKKYEPAVYVPPPVRSLSPSGKDSPTKSNKKDKKDKSTAAVTPEPPPQEEEVKVEAKVEVKIPEQPFQQLYLTCPDGLSISYFLASSVGVAPDDSMVGSLLVRQSYPFPTSGNQPTETLRKVAMDEVSRVVNSNGTVVKVMRDGTTQVLFANGTVSQFVLSSPLITTSGSDSQRSSSVQSDHEATHTKKKDRSRSASKKKEQPVHEEPVEEVTPDPGYWITTTPSGERVATMMDGSKASVKQALVCKATDPQTKQVMYTREDHTIIIEHPNNTTVVEHADGTRITTFISEIRIPINADQSETDEEAAMENKQVKLIQVECPGFATLRFDAETNECSTEFGTGTIVNTFMDGSYDVYHNEGGCLRIEADGTGVYHSRPNNDLEVMDPNHRLQYVMCHFADVIVENVDNQGNLFNVSNQGECTVMAADIEEFVKEDVKSAEQEMVDQEHHENDYEGHSQDQGHSHIEGGDADENRQHAEGRLDMKTKVIETYKQHAPKFFIVHPDGSGTELLRFQDVSEFIAAAEDDLTTAILMDPLPDYPGVLGITVMKPYTKDVSSRWIRDYSQTSIIPPGLISRDLTTLPAKEEKKDGPKFGTNVGQGLAVGSLVKSPLQPPILRCPSTLEVRQLLQYKPASSELRDKLGSGLREYAEYMKSRLMDSEALQVQDPRSEDEKILAADLQSQILGDADNKPDKLDGDVKALYEEMTACTTPSPPPTPQPKRSQADWDRDVRDVAEEQESRKALREHDVPPYFESHLGKAFLLTQAPDMDALTKQLAEDPRRDETRAIRSNSDTSQSEQIALSYSALPQDPLLRELSSSDRSMSISPEGHQGQILQTSTLGPSGNTPSTLRPGNPTPAHAAGRGSPTSLRPHNPTPAHATKVVPDRIAPAGTVQTQSDSPSSHTYPSIPEHVLSNATDDSESTSVNAARIPGYIKAGRPGAIPNNKFQEIEDPVRRKTYTTSITGATTKGSYILSRMRGFELLPDYVDLGTLREGSTYQMNVFLKNTGVDACRFKVKQPPPSTGMKVIYKPGPVAAGMKVALTLEVYAIAVGVEGDRGVGKITHDLEVISETDHLMLPITATVLTSMEYDNRSIPSGCKAPGVKWISDKAPGGQAIIRPRKLDKNGREVRVY